MCSQYVCTYGLRIRMGGGDFFFRLAEETNGNGSLKQLADWAMGQAIAESDP